MITFTMMTHHWHNESQCFTLHSQPAVSRLFAPILSRYTHSKPFTALNVDVRLQPHLLESLEAFVKGDLLEGNNAYWCEKCNKKVCVYVYMCTCVCVCVSTPDPPSSPYPQGGYCQEALHQEATKGAGHPTQEI